MSSFSLHKVCGAGCCHCWNALIQAKFDEDGEVSSQKRHAALRRFHAEMCKCGLTIDECHARAVRRARKEIEGRYSYADDVQIKSRAKELECER